MCCEKKNDTVEVNHTFRFRKNVVDVENIEVLGTEIFLPYKRNVNVKKIVLTANVPSGLESVTPPSGECDWQGVAVPDVLNPTFSNVAVIEEISPEKFLKFSVQLTSDFTSGYIAQPIYRVQGLNSFSNPTSDVFEFTIDLSDNEVQTITELLSDPDTESFEVTFLGYRVIQTGSFANCEVTTFTSLNGSIFRMFPMFSTPLESTTRFYFLVKLFEDGEMINHELFIEIEAGVDIQSQYQVNLPYDGDIVSSYILGCETCDSIPVPAGAVACGTFCFAGNVFARRYQGTKITAGNSDIENDSEYTVIQSDETEFQFNQHLQVHECDLQAGSVVVDTLAYNVKESGISVVEFALTVTVKE